MSTAKDTLEKNIQLLSSKMIDKDSGESVTQFFVNDVVNASKAEDWSVDLASKAGAAFVEACKKWKIDINSFYKAKINNLEQKVDSYSSQQKSYASEANSYVKTVKETKKGFNNINETVYKKVITNHAAYNLAVQNANEAERLYKQSKSELDSTKSELRKYEKKLDEILKNLYSVPLMNESQDFLSLATTSDIISSSDLEKELKGQLFYIRNAYRKNYDEVEKIITDNSSKFVKTWIYKLPEELNYGGRLQVTFEKIKSNADVAYTSSSTTEINCNYLIKQEFGFKKKNIDTAITKLTEAKKDFNIERDGNLVVIKLDIKLENDAAVANIPTFITKLEEYQKDAENLFKMCKENGATTNKASLFFTKIKNKISGFFNKGKNNAEKQEIEAKTESEETNENQ